MTYDARHGYSFAPRSPARVGAPVEQKGRQSGPLSYVIKLSHLSKRAVFLQRVAFQLRQHGAVALSDADVEAAIAAALRA